MTESIASRWPLLPFAGFASPLVLLTLVGLSTACADKGTQPLVTPDSGAEVSDDSGSTDTEEVLPAEWPILVRVTLDGEPAEGVLLVQPGGEHLGYTDASGTLQANLDTTVQGAIAIAASHPEARLAGDQFFGAPPDEVEIALTRFDTSDNLAYEFQPPGSPDNSATTAYCAHCHRTFIDDWWASAHRSATSNPAVQDLYAGAAAAWVDQASCESKGGRWWAGLEPGTRAATERCYVGDGVLPALNEACGETSSCDDEAEAFGQCADCHAPAIDGVLGGRDLLEATDHAYEGGIHCDLCHKVESVDLESKEPGVAGRLRVLRPAEESTSPVLGPYAPITFGPYPDVLNPRMGSVQRDHFANGELCGGCHEYEQEVMVPGASLDSSRWPEGRLPVHTTWSEREASPFAEGVACTSCHMPPQPDVGNGADLGVYIGDEWIDTSTGYYREPGSVRHHAWYGPRSETQRMIDLAAALDLSAERVEGGLLVTARTQNVGPAHAIPTGEPLRHLVLLVEASCDGEALASTGGHVVPDFGGERGRKELGEDWSAWPEAEAGDRIRVLARSGAWHDYEGYGPFGDGRFDAEAKGMAEELYVGEVEILAVASDGSLSLSGALPEGDVALLVRDDGAMPEEGDAPRDLAGRPGFAFARVMVGAEGARMVPHFLAVDVASDNRLLPAGGAFDSQHRFEDCAGTVSLEARLVYRSYPGDLAEERGWEVADAIMATGAWEGSP